MMNEEGVPMARSILAVMLVLSTCGIGHAGWLDDAVKSVGKGIGRRAVGDAGSSTYDGAKGAAKDAVKGTDKPVKGQPAPGAVQGARSAPETMPSAGASVEQNETVYSKYDFIPGDKVIFYDDFSDTDVGEFPRKWSLNGPGAKGSNAIEVAEFAGKRFLRSTPAEKGQAQLTSTQYIRLALPGDLPERFTVEFDAHFSEKGGGYPSNYGLFLLKGGSGLPGWTHPGAIWLSGRRCVSMNTETRLARTDNKVHHLAISVNGTFVKAYIDHQRVINDPDGVQRPIKFVGIALESSGRISNDKVMFTGFRLAEGGKSIKSALETDGKIVTHGILFDTGKDVINPESLPTLKMILGLLNDDPGLKFSIEGHTDNQGNKAINQPLSEKRAAAVKTWLAGNGIEEARLKTQGFGDARPIDANNTPEGRANNRRVEFVKF